MTGARIFLAISVLIWLPYGLYCVASPGALAEIAGVAATTATGTTELRAMYGGLQSAAGLLALLAALRPKYAPAVLLAIAFLTAGLGFARLVGVALDGSLDSYTGSAVALELGTAAIAGALLQRVNRAA